VHERLQTVGFDAAIMSELGEMVTQLEAAPAGDAPAVI
jgi:hypothetical protein